MSKDVIPGPDFTIFDPPSTFDLGGSSHIPMPFTEPGEVADRSGDLWLDAFGDRLVHGEMTVTPEQAQAAAQHGWETVLGSEHEGKVTVRRPDPNPGQD
ncbi:MULTISPECIES: hypothetical protein [unclassified Methylobacterium]|uniref:hypothetical protein n=1 Tax=unclassified Methylobacterium TaxID=2615210 RepID=UPI0011C1D638|nr:MULTISPECIES: hypothetical protein [unclassified Methylobacterium]QEE41543.1 hypothetical protein FVA80_23955 [Methylobacterium sp. WL1]TXN57079.1 hypothetical protein FV241_12730 [Methylobacterium sp. WL2]